MRTWVTIGATKLGLTGVFFITALAAQDLSTSSEDESEEFSEEELSLDLVQPRSYAVQRFSEIVSDYQKNQPNRSSDQIIRAKALLSVSEREKENYVRESEQLNQALDENRLKAFEAMIDHYRKKISRLEDRVRE